MGVTSSAFAGIAHDLPPRPIAFGANCGTGAPDLLRTVLGHHRGRPGRGGHRQGERRHPALCRRRDRVRRHARADGALRPARPRRRRPADRRLLRHEARAPGRHARRARESTCQASVRRSIASAPRSASSPRPATAPARPGPNARRPPGPPPRGLSPGSSSSALVFTAIASILERADQLVLAHLRAPVDPLLLRPRVELSLAQLSGRPRQPTSPRDLRPSPSRSP